MTSSGKRSLSNTRKKSRLQRELRSCGASAQDVRTSSSGPFQWCTIEKWITRKTANRAATHLALLPCHGPLLEHGDASAQDAHKPGALSLDADRKPKPPVRSEMMPTAVPPVVVGRSQEAHQEGLHGRCMPQSWPCAYVADLGGGIVRILRWHLGPAHCTKTCQAHCRLGIQWMAFHNLSSSSSCSAHTHSPQVPPHHLESQELSFFEVHTSGPSSSISGRYSPGRFQVRVLTVWSRIPAPKDNFSPKLAH